MGNEHSRRVHKEGLVNIEINMNNPENMGDIQEEVPKGANAELGEKSESIAVQEIAGSSSEETTLSLTDEKPSTSSGEEAASDPNFIAIDSKNESDVPISAVDDTVDPPSGEILVKTTANRESENSDKSLREKLVDSNENVGEKSDGFDSEVAELVGIMFDDLQVEKVTESLDAKNCNSDRVLVEELQNDYETTHTQHLTTSEENKETEGVPTALQEETNKEEYDKDDNNITMNYQNDVGYYNNADEAEVTPTPHNDNSLDDTKKGNRVVLATVKYFSPREVHNEKVIGEGGFGRVLKGSLHGGTPVAIKLFHAPLVISSELDRVLSLKHKNVLQVFGIVHQSDEIDCPQLVLQYISEGSVLQYLSRHENPEDNNTLGKIALDVVEGCQYLHERGIIHGNLAARNILVEKIVGRHKTYYNAKISEIGLYQFAEVSGGNYMKVPGSDRIVPIRWVPKEIIEEQKDGTVGTDFSFASDVWSFGVVLWEIWTRGAIPYGASYSNLRVMQFLKDEYSPLKVYRPKECPPKIVTVMEDIFQINPTKRPSFNQLLDSFKKYKGHGKEHKSKAPGATTVRTPSSNEPVDDSKEGDYQDQEQVRLEEREASLYKKKKNKKAKKSALLNKPTEGATLPPESTHTGAAKASETNGATALPVSQKPPSKQAPGQESSTDSTIAALLKRVNQLEKERRGGGGYRGGRGVQPNNRWQKRSGPPRFNARGGRGGYHEEGFAGDGPSLTPPVPPSSQAPPPYTEDPLPHHSTSRFSAPLPEYEYDHNPGPSSSNSRGGGGSSRGTYGINDPRNRTMVLEATSNSPAREEEDFIRKIKRLAEEIEFLRAEKMTQELLKKSAELADIMKVVTSERRETSSIPVVDPRYPAGSSSMSRSISPRGLVRDDQYYPEEYDFHNEARWPIQNHSRDYIHGRPPSRQSHQQQHRGGSNPQRRPYYKGRGGASGQRGHYNSGRFNDGDGGGGSYGYGN